MKTVDFENAIYEIIGIAMKIYQPINPKDKYTSYLPAKSIKPSTKYMVYFDGMLRFTFNTTTKNETFIKSFVNKYVSWKSKQFDWSLGYRPKKHEIVENLTKRNSKRVAKYNFYTTLYGIGTFAGFFNPKAIDEITKNMHEYLKANNISYTNEFSDAGWAYRFVIGEKVENHNQLLNNYKNT